MDRNQTGNPRGHSARIEAVRQRVHALASAAMPDPVAAAAHRMLAPRSWRKEHMVLATLFATVTTLVAAIAPGFASATRRPSEPAMVTHAVVLPEAALIESGVDAGESEKHPTATAAADWQTITVESGQTLGGIFATLDLPATTLHRLLQQPGVSAPLARIRAGTQFQFLIAAPGELRAMRFDRDEASRVLLTFDGDRIDQQIEERALQHRVRMARGEIEGSLFGAGAKAGLSNGAIVELAKVFGYDIDFAQDLRVGDRFSVVYEEIYRDGERLRAGDILAATFVNQGKTYTAFRYEFADGRTEYFDDTGRPLKKSFLRIPVEFTRISSLFSTARKHPILGRVRAHQGVDYAAGTGTPIMSAGDGRIAFAGWKNGYGRTVIVDHGRGYTTLYGHMSRFAKAKTGARVRQGETIGFVGMSGLASGPHLHYEFRINGAHRDPLKVTLPKPEPLPRTELARFRLQTQPMLAKLQMIDGSRAYASR
jgi:murein DD-endopeptidase MepM/ murein hydrolase activator NlpD